MSVAAARAPARSWILVAVPAVLAVLTVLALPAPVSPGAEINLDALRAAYRMGRDLTLAGRHAAAAEAFGQAVAHPTLRAHAQYEQAAALLRSGSPGAASAAAGILRFAAHSAPARLRGRMLIALGEAEMALGRPAQAVAALQEAAALRPDDPDVWLRLGSAAAAAGRRDPRRAAEIEARYRLHRGRRLAADGEWSQAATEFRAVAASAAARRSVAGEAWYRLGEIHIYADPRGAHDAFRRAARLGWNIPAAWYWAAVAARRAGLGAAARQAASALLEAQPRGIWASRHWLGIGLRAESAGRRGEAAAHYGRAIAAAPGSGEAAEARWRLGWIALIAGRSTEAEARFKEAARAAPYRSEEARAWYWVAKALEARGRRPSAGRAPSGEAEALLRRIAQEYPLTFHGQRARARLGMPAPTLQPAPAAAPEALHGAQAAPAHEELARLGLDADAALAAEDSLDASPGRRDLRVVRFLAKTHARLGAVRRSVAYAEEALAGGVRDEAVWRLAYPRAYWPEATRAAQAAGVDALLLLALVREESRYDPVVISPARAVGLAQILPTTAQAMTGDASITASRLKDPEANLLLGARYLRLQLDRFGGDLRLALAAYNAGPGAAYRWKDLDADPDYFIEKIGYAETRAYVRRVLGSYGVYRLLW